MCENTLIVQRDAFIFIVKNVEHVNIKIKKITIIIMFKFNVHNYFFCNFNCFRCIVNLTIKRCFFFFIIFE